MWTVLLDGSQGLDDDAAIVELLDDLRAGEAWEVALGRCHEPNVTRGLREAP